MIFLVVVCLFSGADSFHNGTKTSWTSSRTPQDWSLGRHEEHPTFKTFVDYTQPTRNEVKNEVISPARLAKKNSAPQRILGKKLASENVNKVLDVSPSNELSQQEKFKGNLFYTGKSLEELREFPVVLNKTTHHKLNKPANFGNLDRTKRSSPPCLPKQISVRTSGQKTRVNAGKVRVYAFTPLLPIEIKATAVLCCYLLRRFNFELSARSSEISMHSQNQWQEFEVTFTHWSWANKLQIRNLLQGGSREKQEAWARSYHLELIEVVVSGRDVKWYEGRKRHDCSRYGPTTTTKSSPPTTPTTPTTTTPKSNTQTRTEIAPTEAPTFEAITPPEMNMTSEAHASSDALTGLHLLWLLLPLVVILVVVCAVVVVQRKKAKTNAPRQISDSFRRESINSLYGVAAETRKTSINSLYGVDLRPDSSNHIYANDDHRHTSVSGAGDRNKGGLTATRSWVDPQRGNAYYEADPPHHASLSTKPHLYDNQC